MTIQAYMPAFLEGKKEGMDVLATAILGELNAYAASHMDEPAPAPELYNRLVELCRLAKKGEPNKVYVVENAYSDILGVYSAQPLAESAKELSASSHNLVVEEWEVKDEVGN